MIEKLNRSCLFDVDSNTKGWRCDNYDNDCLPLNQICDGAEDCLPDKSDEDLGCKIFAGMNTLPFVSLFGKLFRSIPNSR